jgi:hypothetical protein
MWSTCYEKNSIVVGDFNMVIFNEEKRGETIVWDYFKERMEDISYTRT